jgi:putative sporulation protein YtxC
MGGTWLVTIAFSHPSDGIAILKKILQVAKNNRCSPSFAKLSETSSKYLELSIHEGKEFILDVLTDYTRNKVEDICINEMIEHAFLYKDSAEKKEIFSIAKNIISGEIEGIPEAKTLPCLNDVIRIQWDSLLRQPVSFLEFEAFLKFRLREYLSALMKLVECAIDEYKLEMEYQLFVDQLRGCISRQKSFSTKKIVVIFDRSTTVIFNEYQHAYSEQEVFCLHKKALRLTNAKDLDKRLLGPLIGLTPLNAKIYSYDVDHPLMQTIKNVFQERVSILPIEAMSKKEKRHYKKKS